MYVSITELKVGPCNANTHDAMLNAAVCNSQLRGGFLTLEALRTQIENDFVIV